MSKVDKVAMLINKAIDKVDNSLNHKIFAAAVAKVIKEDYGDHLISPILNTIKSELKKMESNIDKQIEDKVKEQKDVATMTKDFGFINHTYEPKFDNEGNVVLDFSGDDKVTKADLDGYAEKMTTDGYSVDVTPTTIVVKLGDAGAVVDDQIEQVLKGAKPSEVIPSKTKTEDMKPDNFTVKLMNGDDLHVTSAIDRGMVGEPMEKVTMKYKDKPVQFKNIKDKLAKDDYTKLSAYLKQVADANYASAVAWCK